MSDVIEIEITKKINTSEIRKIYEKANWLDAGEFLDDEKIIKIVENSYCFATAKKSGDIIGMGRALSDGVSDAYIQDVSVLPDFRGQGIGKRIINVLLDHLKSNSIKWIALISEPGYEDFYKPLGFSIMRGYTPMKYKG